MEPFRYQWGAQKGPFDLKQTLTGRKPSDPPMTPHECPKQHKTLCVIGLYCYSTFSHPSRYFRDSMGAQRGLICPKTALLDPLKTSQWSERSKRSLNSTKNLPGLAPPFCLFSCHFGTVSYCCIVLTTQLRSYQALHMMCQKTFFPSAKIEHLYLKLGKQILEVRKIAPHHHMTIRQQQQHRLYKLLLCIN